MTKPQRIQLSRKAGFRLQEVSLALNGLPAVNVARPSLWGNPYRVSHIGSGAYVTSDPLGSILHRGLRSECMAVAVQFHRSMIERGGQTREALATLRGKNLGCWCAIGGPCHAAVLLDLANMEAS